MKKSGYVKKLQQQRSEDSYQNFIMARQLMIDLLTIVLNREFGFGKVRLRRMWDAFATMHNEFVTVWNADSKDIEYTKEVLDRELQKICGEHFIPWKERYIYEPSIHR